MTVPLADIPRIATYRLQFTPTFGFRHAQEILPYLRDLGVSHIYASPIAQATPGSQHGYDVCDPRQVNPDLGTRAELIELLEAVRAHGLGWVQDVVPNHMAMSPHNPYLCDVMTFGRRSRWAFLFDIDWTHPDVGGRILMPILAEPYGHLLQQGAFRLGWSERGPVLRYGDHQLPLAPGSVVGLLTESGLPPAFIAVLAAAQEETDADQRAIYLCAACRRPAAELAQAEAVLGAITHAPLIDEILQAQAWRLAWWRTSRELCGYRRFFAVDGLIAVRNEDPRTFPLIHALTCELYDDGLIDGVRVDHVDGLWDPAAYLARLRARLPKAWILVEKILAAGEALPPWQVDGTTGYEIINALTGVCCNPRAEARFTALHQRLVGRSTDATLLATQVRQDIDGLGLGGDLDRTVSALRATADSVPCLRDLGRRSLREALAALIARLPVYRTYGGLEGGSDSDHRMMAQARVQAQRDRPELTPIIDAVASLLEQGLRTRTPGPLLDAVARVQQLSGPVMAKGWEDTFLFRWSRCLALNEVGGDPRRFGLDPATFIDLIAQRPPTGGLNASATHDTKRGEDVRARMAALTWRVERWQELVNTWEHAEIDGQRACEAEAPTAEDRYHLYQTLTGTWPVDGVIDETYRQRLRAYALKAVREAGSSTSWAAPDTIYEAALASWLEVRLSGAGGREFRRQLSAWVELITPHAAALSLVQTALKCTIPGVPDVYQGTEWHDDSLVDPDNRRPVDFTARARALRDEKRFTGPVSDPHTKQALLAACLQMRRSYLEPWRRGSLQPLQIVGESEGLLAFARVSAEAVAIVVVCFRPEGPDPMAEVVLTPAWSTYVWREVFSRLYLPPAPVLSVTRLLRHLPCAILICEQALVRKWQAAEVA